MKEPGSFEGIADAQTLEALAIQLSDLKDQRRELEEERSAIAIEMETNMSQDLWKREKKTRKDLKIQTSDSKQSSRSKSNFHKVL